MAFWLQNCSCRPFCSPTIMYLLNSSCSLLFNNYFPCFLFFFIGFEMPTWLFPHACPNLHKFLLLLSSKTSFVLLLLLPGREKCIGSFLAPILWPPLLLLLFLLSRPDQQAANLSSTWFNHVVRFAYLVGFLALPDSFGKKDCFWLMFMPLSCPPSPCYCQCHASTLSVLSSCPSSSSSWCYCLSFHYWSNILLFTSSPSFSTALSVIFTENSHGNWSRTK